MKCPVCDGEVDTPEEAEDVCSCPSCGTELILSLDGKKLVELQMEGEDWGE